MKNPIKIAVAGLGRAGWLIHINDLKFDPRFEIVAVTDPDSVRREEAIAALGCRAYSTVKTLLEDKNIEVVVVATPSVNHFEDASLVLNSGRHCVVEKPMATSYETAVALSHLANQRATRSLFVHHQQPFRGEFAHLRGVIDSRILGEVFHIEACWARYSRRWDWQTLKKNGGGILNNHGSHALSVVLPLLDAPVSSVAADLRNIKDAGDTEDHVNLLLKTEGGRNASVTVTSVSALPATRWRLLGSHGTLTSDGITSTLRYCDPNSLPAIEAIDAPAPGRAYQQEEIRWKEETRPVESAEATEGFYSNVYHVLRENGRMRVRPEDALEIMRVIHLARIDAGRRPPPPSSAGISKTKNAAELLPL